MKDMAVTINETLNKTLNYTQLYYEEQTRSGNLAMFLFLTIGIIIGLILFYQFVVKKDQKKAIEKVGNQKEIVNQIKNYIEKIEELEKKRQKGDLTVREININDLPEDVKGAFIKNEGIYKAFNDKAKSEVAQPWLFLIMNSGEIEIKQDVKPGNLPLTTPKGETKWIDIDPTKIRKLKWGDKRIDCYIGYEDEAELYPHQPKHHARRFYMIVEALQLNKGNLMGQPFKIGKWLIIGVIVLVVGIIAWYVFAPKAAPIIAQNMTNVTNASRIIIQNVTVR